MLKLKNNSNKFYFRWLINFVKRMSSLLTSKERKLSVEFAYLTSGIIALIVLFMGLYINNMMSKLNDKAQLQTNTLNVSLAATIINMIAEDIDNNQFYRIPTKLEHMITNKIIAYIVVQDNITKKIEYTSLPDKVVAVVNQGALTLLNNSDSAFNDTRYIKGVRAKYTVYIGFFIDQIFKSYFDTLIKQLAVLIFLFMIMGLMLSYFLSRKIISPLNSLVNATSAFGQGDLSNRAEETDYIEINELVSSYNSMADALQRLYSSMGHQVQERTQQLEAAYKELQDTQAMMVHSEKMKSLGELVAGIMHEINNPINFIYGNLSHLSNYSADLIQVIDEYEKCESDLNPEQKEAITKFKKEIDYEFLKTDLPDLIRSCKEGTERTKNIILDLKNFSRLEEIALTDVDLPKEIETTLNILHNKFKNKIEVHKEYEEGLPRIEAYGGQLNQVFMNILDNACYAIKEKGDVWIRMKILGKNVIIEFEDNGSGMDENTASKIFNPFFTTKPVGQGTGMGMAISYKVIKNHDGEIKVSTEIDKGTKFTIILPISIREKEAEKRSNLESDIEEIIL